MQLKTDSSASVYHYRVNTDVLEKVIRVNDNLENKNSSLQDDVVYGIMLENNDIKSEQPKFTYEGTYSDKVDNCQKKVFKRFLKYV